MNAVFRLEYPKVQNPLGIDPESDVVVEVEEVQSWPPLLHSHVMLSFPRWSSTIMMIARTAEITIMKGQTNLATRIQR